MRISVVMCTRNRAEQLRCVLDSAVALVVPPDLSWEFVLVDNGSTDHTAEVAASYAGRLPIRCVREDKPGLSNARNRGVAEARGEYICWTDDDVVIDPNWLAAYAEAFTRHPEAAFFGGVIEPVLEGNTPAWFSENRELLSYALAERDFGTDVVSLRPEDDRMPFGANFAIRIKEQREFLYDTALGVAPGIKRLGEESDVLSKIVQVGGTGWWTPSARVKHIIPASRQTLKYVQAYQASAGETWAYLSSTRQLSGFAAEDLRRSRLFGAPKWLWRAAGWHKTLYLLRRPTAVSRIWLRHWCQAAYYSGAIAYLLRQDDKT